MGRRNKESCEASVSCTQVVLGLLTVEKERLVPGTAGLPAVGADELCGTLRPVGYLLNVVRLDRAHDLAEGGDPPGPRSTEHSVPDRAKRCWFSPHRVDDAAVAIEELGHCDPDTRIVKLTQELLSTPRKQTNIGIEHEYRSRGLGRGPAGVDPCCIAAVAPCADDRGFGRKLRHLRSTRIRGIVVYGNQFVGDSGHTLAHRGNEVRQEVGTIVHHDDDCDVLLNYVSIRLDLVILACASQGAPTLVTFGCEDTGDLTDRVVGLCSTVSRRRSEPDKPSMRKNVPADCGNPKVSKKARPHAPAATAASSAWPIARSNSSLPRTRARRAHTADVITSTSSPPRPSTPPSMRRPR